MLFSNITVMGDRALGFIQSASKDYDILAFTETHVDADHLDDWRRQVYGEGWKLITTPARKSGKIVSAHKQRFSNEGGEWVIARRHLEVHPFDIFTGSDQDGSIEDPFTFDGFTVAMVALSGMTVALIVFYGFPSVGLTARNWTRFIRLGNP